MPRRQAQALRQEEVGTQFLGALGIALQTGLKALASSHGVQALV
jgi:hypothetical protein